MAKITINDILASFAGTTAINLRFQQVEDELNDKVLYRNNPVGEPNSMLNDLDMGGFSILNGTIDASVNIDATTLDGLDSTQFLRSDQSDTSTGIITAVGFVGPLTGDVTGTLTGNVIGNLTGNVTGNLIGSADTLDGIDSTQFVRSDVADSISGNITNLGLVTLNGGWQIASTTVNATANQLNTLVGVTVTAADLNTSDTSLYLPDAASPAIANIATRANQFLGFDALGELIYSAGSTTVSASAVSIADTGNYYSAVEVESALQEIGLSNALDITTDLAATTPGEGASLVGINDTGGYYTGTTVETVLQELAIFPIDALASVGFNGRTEVEETIPAHATRITMVLSDVSADAIGHFDVSLKRSTGGYSASGYDSVSYLQGGAATTSSAEIRLASSVAIADSVSGILTLLLTDPANNTWSFNGIFSTTAGTTKMWNCSGSKTEAVAIDGIKFVFNAGAGAGDAGQVRFFYE